MSYSKIKQLIFEFVPKGSFRANVLTMMTGTGVAQFIPIVASPVLTRLYSPSDFGLFVLYISIAVVLTTIAAARYDQAVILPDNDTEAIQLIMISLLIVAFFSVFLFLFFLFFSNSLSMMLGNPEIAFWLHCVPFSVLFSGAVLPFTYWLNRKKQFVLLSKRRMIQASVMVFVQLVLGSLSLKISGLIIGWITGEASVLLFFLINFLLQEKEHIKWPGTSQIKLLAVKFRNFPVYDIPATLINVLSNQLPTILFSSFFGPVIAGFYGFTQRILNAPVTLIATSVGDVFRQRATHDYLSTGSCRRIYSRIFIMMGIVGLVFFIGLVSFAPALFVTIFGEQWRVAGQYAQIMAIFYSLRFVASPLSFVFTVVRKQKYNLIIQVFLFIFSFSTISIGAYYDDPKISVLGFSLSYAFLYAIVLIWTYRLSARQDRQLLNIC